MTSFGAATRGSRDCARVDAGFVPLLAPPTDCVDGCDSFAAAVSAPRWAVGTLAPPLSAARSPLTVSVTPVTSATLGSFMTTSDLTINSGTFHCVWPINFPNSSRW